TSRSSTSAKVRNKCSGSSCRGGCSIFLGTSRGAFEPARRLGGSAARRRSIVTWRRIWPPAAKPRTHRASAVVPAGPLLPCGLIAVTQQKFLRPCPEAEVGEVEGGGAHSVQARTLSECAHGDHRSARRVVRSRSTQCEGHGR